MREFSFYKGVKYDEPNGQWVAKWGKNHLGYYQSEIKAARVVKNYLSHLYCF